MKKFLLGLFIGIGLMFTGAVYADDIKSLIGQQVQGTFPIYLQDSQLQTDAIVVNNTSYLPVRVIGELLNLDVSFIDNQVKLKAKDGAAVNADKLAQWQKDKDANQKLDDDLKAKLKAEQDAYDAAHQKALADEAAKQEERKKIMEEDAKKQQLQQQNPQSTNP